MRNCLYSQVIFLFPRNISFPPRRGDSQRVFLIAEATFKCGLDATVFYFDKGNPFIYREIEFYPLPGSVSADPSKVSKFSIINAFKDVVYFSLIIMRNKTKMSENILYAHTPIGGLVGLILKIFARAPLIYDPHDWFYEDWVFYHRNLSNLKRTSTSILFKLLNIVLEKFVDFFVCVSPEMMDAVKTCRSKILIPNFAKKIYVPKKSRESKITDENKQSILFVGHVAVYQGIIKLLKAFKMSLEKNHNIELLIIGDGEDMELAKQFVKKNKLKNVIFTGSLSHDDVYSYIRKATLCVAPFLSLSFVKTSCPIKLLEYAAFNKKIVTTDIPAFRKLLLGYDNVYFSGSTTKSLSQTMLFALNKKVLIQNNIKTKNNFNKKNLRKSLCELYELVEEKKV